MKYLCRSGLYFFLFLVATLLSINSFSQAQNYIPSIIPPSPNASTLLKFSDIPVSAYTGTSDISVPIYTIQLKGMQIPVSLNYHTGGIKIKEEAGWAGLGWALSAGGAISRTILGKDDFDGPSYFGTFIPQLPGDLVSPQPAQAISTPSYRPPPPDYGLYVFDFFCSYNVAVSGGIMDFTNAFGTGSDIWDLEPDIYNYNFAGHAGKFMITRLGKVILQKQENIVVQFESNGNSFTITDDNGNKFYFVEKEYTQPSTGGHLAVSSWNLTKVITQQQDSLTLFYATDGTSTYVAPEYNETYTTHCTGPEGYSLSNGAGTFYTNKYLQTIDFPSGQLQFNFDSQRSDLKAGKKLNNIKLYSKTGSAINYVKENDLYYSYYDGSATAADSLEKKRLRLDSVKEISGSLSLPPYVFSYNPVVGNSSILKHGFSVDHWGYFNGVPNSTFIPTQSVYYDPYAQPFDQTGTIIYTGANREADNTPNATYASSFSLKQIKYPTGGKTDLAYEPNDYDNQKSTISPSDFPQVALVVMQPQIQINNYCKTINTIDFSHISPMIAQGMPGINLSMNVTFRGSNLPTLHSSGPFGKMYVQVTGPSFNQIVDITTQGLTCGAVCTIHYDMSVQAASVPQIYTITGFVDSAALPPGSFSQIVVNFQYNETQIVANGSNPTLTGGGLRLKSITDYSAENIVAKKRTYDYDYLYDGNGDGTLDRYSYGKLMSPPSYVRYSMIPQSEGGVCAQLSIYGSSVTSLTSVTQGNSVGYSQVTEYVVDSSSSQNNGKTTYTYFNSPDSSVTYHGYGFPGIMNIGNNLNGLMLSKTDFANMGTYYRKVDLTFNNYRTANRSVYFTPKYQYTNQTSSTSFCGVGGKQLYETFAVFYPTLKSERILLDSVINYLYDQFDSTKWVKTVQSNYYDNPKHYQLTRSVLMDSKNNIHINSIKYPQDYLVGTNAWTGNTVIDTLIGRNIVSSVIEKRDSLYYNGAVTGGVVVGATLNRYRAVNSKYIGLDKQYQLDKLGPIKNFQPFSFTNNTLSQDIRFRQMLSFDGYDASNNIQQFTSVDQTPISILWDYKNEFPVAQVKNASVADIAFTSFEAENTGSWNVPSAGVTATYACTGMKSYNFSSNQITKTGLTIGRKYTLSYWSRGSTCNIVGGTATSITGRSVNGWTYYEQTVTMTATTLTLTGSTYIDELRLYPVGSQMTSLNYQPVFGVTSMNDPNSEITSYEYDLLTRLKNIRDYQGSIINNFQYNYAQSCSSCTVPMQTFSHSGTLSYPVGVFSVSAKLIGNATTPAQYISMWNSNIDNQAIGSLAVGYDSMHFILNVSAGKTSPGFVTGCRYYQFQLPYTQFDAARHNNGVYVDFGDGSGMFLGKYDGDTTVTLASNTIQYVYYNWIGAHPYWIHSYPDASLKTLTFYHNDGIETMNVDNNYSPANSLMLLRNLSGNLPQNTLGFGSNVFQQATANSIAGIINWNTITSMIDFSMTTGDYMNPCLNIAFPQDFMANNKDLSTITTTRGYYLEGYEDASFKLSKLKTNWNIYFSNLTSIIICDDHWNRENLSSLLKLKVFGLVAGNQNHSFIQTNNPLVPVPVAAIDNIISQIAAGAGRSVLNGVINLATGGTTRSASSDNGFNTLKTMGWTIVINNVTL